jgi:hypothetical protein
LQKGHAILAGKRQQAARRLGRGEMEMAQDRFLMLIDASPA